MTQSTSQVGNLNITTQVLPATNTIDSTVPTSVKNFVPVLSKHFQKAPVKALSTLLMLTGITQLSIGFVMYSAESGQLSLAVRSGVSLWGGLVVLTAGCTSLIALLKDTIDLMKLCMVCNIVNITVGAIGVIVYAIQIYTETQTCWLEESQISSTGCSSTSKEYYYYGDTVMKLRIGIIAIIIIFSLFGVAISCVMTKVSDKALKASGYSLLR